MDARRLIRVLLIGSWSVAAVALYCCTSVSGLDDKVFDLGGGGAGATTSNGGSGAGVGGSAGEGGSGGSVYRLATPTWAVRLGGDGVDYAAAVAVGPSEEIVIAGFYEGYLPLPGDCSLGVAAGPMQIFVAKLTAPDECAWSTSFGDLDSRLELDVAVDDNGHVFVVGGLDGSVPAGQMGSPQAAHTTDSYDGFYLEYDADGGYEDHHFYGGEGTQRLSGVAIGDDGNKFVVGHHERSMTIEGCAAQTACTGCEDDVIVARIGADGGCRHVHGLPSADEQHGNAVARGSDGTVVFTGLVRGDIQFADASVPGGGDMDIYVASIELDAGEHRWIHRWGDDDQNQSGESVAVAPNTGDVFVTGRLRGQADFGNGLEGNSSDDAFLVRLSDAGVVQYGRPFGAQSLAQSGAAVIARSGGAALLGGTFEGTVECSGHDIEAVGSDIFLARFGPDGAAEHCQSFRSSLTFAFADMVARGDQSVVLFGHFQGELEFGDDTLVSQGTGDDLFLALVELLPGL